MRHGWETDARWLATANDGWAAVLAATRLTGPGAKPLAADERIGELGEPVGAAPLRRFLEAELGRALYPEMTGLVPTGTLVQEFAAVGTDTGSKRFRLVQALILALRRLGDRQALGPFLGGRQPGGVQSGIASRLFRR